MKKMNKIEQAKFGMKAKLILDDLEKHPEKQDKLIRVLDKNGFGELSSLLSELREWNGGK